MGESFPTIFSVFLPKCDLCPVTMRFLFPRHNRDTLTIRAILWPRPKTSVASTIVVYWFALLVSLMHWIWTGLWSMFWSSSQASSVVSSIITSALEYDMQEWPKGESMRRMVPWFHYPKSWILLAFKYVCHTFFISVIPSNFWPPVKIMKLFQWKIKHLV